jgi:hypothetical protein
MGNENGGWMRRATSKVVSRECWSGMCIITRLGYTTADRSFRYWNDPRVAVKEPNFEVKCSRNAFHHTMV